jgi:hypothetical protein
VLPLEMFPKSVEGLIAGEGARVTITSNDVVGVFPKQITDKATSIIFIVEYLLSPCRWKEIMHEL